MSSVIDYMFSHAGHNIVLIVNDLAELKYYRNHIMATGRVKKSFNSRLWNLKSVTEITCISNSSIYFANQKQNLEAEFRGMSIHVLLFSEYLKQYPDLIYNMRLKLSPNMARDSVYGFFQDEEPEPKDEPIKSLWPDDYIKQLMEARL